MSWTTIFAPVHRRKWLITIIIAYTAFTAPLVVSELIKLFSADRLARVAEIKRLVEERLALDGELILGNYISWLFAACAVAVEIEPTRAVKHRMLGRDIFFPTNSFFGWNDLKWHVAVMDKKEIIYIAEIAYFSFGTVGTDRYDITTVGARGGVGGTICGRNIKISYDRSAKITRVEEWR